MYEITLVSADNSITITETQRAINLTQTINEINFEQTGRRGLTGQGVVAGGTTGQFLTKINSTDYNTQWVDGYLRINHGSNANATRLATTSAVIWYGLVEPLQAIDGDLWIEV